MKFKNKKRIFSIMTCVLIMGGLISFMVFNGTSKIDNVLKSESYAYLPDEAKEYIKEMYEETGAILLTEKNKEVDVPYLNPDYIEYLDNSEQYDIIPEPTITDFNPKKAIVNNNSYPSTYNLWDVEGNSYVAPAKDQGNFGLCWDFATTSHIESFLLVNSNTPYSANAKSFSERQVDYATSNNGILEGNDFYSFREMGDGGNFSHYMFPALDGLALVDTSFNGGISNYNSVEKLEARKVFRHSDSQYEVNSTVNYPFAILDTLSEEERITYINGLKDAVMNYGGFVVSLDGPNSRCSIDYNSSRLIYDDGNCYSIRHAMHIIGWDDDAEYSLCTNVKTGNLNSISNDISNCPSENIVNGKGVWLVKNSYGTNTVYYMAYDTKGLPLYNFITDLSESTWDNNNLSYNISPSLQEIELNNASKKVKSYIFAKKNSGQEKIEKIKYNESGQNREYNIYLDAGEGLEYLGTLNTTYSGYYNFDLSDKNIYVNNDTFTLYFDVDLPQEELESSYNVLAENRIRIYTSNLDNDIRIKTNDVEYTGDKIVNDNKYLLFVKSNTKNLNEGTIIDYKILDSNNEEITYAYEYSNNEVFMNHIYSTIKINENLPAGDYTLQTIYNNNVYSTSTIKIDKELVYMSGGTGTIDDPYLIETAEQLNLIRLDQSAYYKLVDNIDLSYDTQNPNGKFYNDGKGWQPIAYSDNKCNYFYGGLDGNGYTIKGLYINRPEENNVGLFARVSPYNHSLLQVKNINFEDVNINGNNLVGALAGHADGIDYINCIELFNISVLSGSITGSNIVGGIVGLLNGGSDLKGYCNSGGDRQIFHDFYNGATISGNNLIGGIFGNFAQFMNSARPVPLNVNNIQNTGDVEGSTSAGGLFGGLKLFDGKTTTISNAINVGNVNGQGCRNDISCNVNSQGTSGILELNNIYYKNISNITTSDVTINYNNVNKYSINDIKNIDNYSDWSSFNDYWTIKEIDNIDRIPVLKFVPFLYTTIDDININYGEQVNLYDFINPKIDKAKDVSYEIEDTSIATIDEEGNIVGIKKGTTNIHIISNYDGYEDDIPITVKNTGMTINYDSNGGNGTMESTYIPSGKLGETSANAFTRIGYKFKSWNTKADGTGTKYSVYEKIINDYEDDYTMTLYAIWEKELDYEINNYSVDETNKYISKIMVNTPINTFTANFSLGYGYGIDVDSKEINNQRVLYTGGKTRITYGLDLYAEYTNIVVGDINGDGAINSADLLKIRQHLLSTNILTGAYFLSSDINYDDTINSADLLRVRQHLLGTRPIE